ncbi:pyridoxamine 5'-phosphate oxidase family protein [Haloarchaeobius sp. TZWWS8]|uniref:pyridoxamine 5'-phosphate oxidase family protein n=1 Tax=Haloarchaeobius sp. TZWWS8 TaxID=3446121 RepID=UPI003EBCA78D
MEHVEYVYTFGMDEDEVAQRLREQGHGVLSLADDCDAYAVPISYSYRETDGYVCIRLADHEGSEKMAFAEATKTASLVLYGTDGPDDSWSIVVRGELVRSRDLSDAEVNERYQPLRVFGEDVGELTPMFWELRPTEITGRRTGDAATPDETARDD